MSHNIERKGSVMGMNLEKVRECTDDLVLLARAMTDDEEALQRLLCSAISFISIELANSMQRESLLGSDYQIDEEDRKECFIEEFAKTAEKEENRVDKSEAFWIPSFGEFAKWVPEYPEYFVTESGDVYSTLGNGGGALGNKARVVSPEKARRLSAKSRKGRKYRQINLRKAGEGRERATEFIHRVVAAAWHGGWHREEEEKHLVRHLNDISTDNRPENLAWGTQADNTKDAKRNRVYRSLDPARDLEISTHFHKFDMNAALTGARFEITNSTVYNADRRHMKRLNAIHKMKQKIAASRPTHHNPDGRATACNFTLDTDPQSPVS